MTIAYGVFWLSIDIKLATAEPLPMQRVWSGQRLVRLLGLGPQRLAQPQARPLAVLVDETDAGAALFSSIVSVCTARLDENRPATSAGQPSRIYAATKAGSQDRAAQEGRD